jgi:hypothetical protein
MIDMDDVHVDLLPFVGADRLGRLPRESAVYFVVNEAKTILYIGQSINLYQRWAMGHNQLQSFVAQSFHRVHWLCVAREELEYTEAYAIAHFNPLLNSRHPRASGMVVEEEKLLCARLPDALAQAFRVRLCEQRLPLARWLRQQVEAWLTHTTADHRPPGTEEH